MDVIFYKTKLSRQNRCYDINAYNAYLSTRQQKIITLSHEIVPNNPFYIETDEAMWDYNYITYTYRGYIFGAFIDSIRIQAISGTTQIIHTTDNWYFALRNVGIENIDFHGQCTRAHVNDIDNSTGIARPTLKNTTAAPEEVFNEANVVCGKTDNFLRGQYYDGTNAEQLAYLYIYIENPRELNITYSGQVMRLTNSGRAVRNTGLTLVYPFFDESYYIYDGSAVPKARSVYELTSSYITAMTISRIPPRSSVEVVVASDLSLELNDFYRDSVVVQPIEIEGLPPVLNYFQSHLSPFVNVASAVNEGNSNVYFSNDVVQKRTVYEDYLSDGIIKLNSSIYNPVYIGDRFVNTAVTNGNDQINFLMSFDLTQIIISVPSGNLEGKTQLYLAPNVSIFAPAVVLDYWTRLNAQQTASAGRIQQDRGIIQAKTLSKSIVKSSLSAVENAAKAGAASLGVIDPEGFDDAIGGIVGGVFGAAKNVVDIGYDAATYGNRANIAGETQRIGEITEEIANRQYRVGTTTGAATSYFSGFVDFNSVLVTYYDNSKNHDALAINLHRYGYNTFLQLDDVYNNHRRTNFNYIQTSDAEVTGLPGDIAADLENMFNSGVHLWSGVVERFEVPNYQEGF